MKILGIVGGIAPESTIEYYRQLIRGYRQRTADGSYPRLLIDSIDLSHLLFLAERAAHGELLDYLLESVSRLARAGADFALLAANTPHVVFGELSAVSPIPLASIVQATCEFAKGQGLKRLGLFATRFTMQAGFYQETFSKQDIAIIPPTSEEQDYIHEKYVNELARGVFLPETRKTIGEIALAVRAREEIDGLILGGTELPLLLREVGHLGIPLLDTTGIHVQAALNLMLGNNGE